MKWKQLYELFDKKRDALEKELNDEKRKLEEEIEYAKYEHETEMLRERKSCLHFLSCLYCRNVFPHLIFVIDM